MTDSPHNNDGCIICTIASTLYPFTESFGELEVIRLHFNGQTMEFKSPLQVALFLAGLTFAHEAEAGGFTTIAITSNKDEEGAKPSPARSALDKSKLH